MKTGSGKGADSMTALSDDEIHTIAAQTLGEHAANQLTGINRFARALLAAQPAVQQPQQEQSNGR